MKRILLSFSGCLIFLMGNYCQGWYPVGAEWYFNDQLEVPYQAHGYCKYTVDGDTTFKQKIAKRIIKKTYWFNDGHITNIDTLYFLEENAKIFYWSGSEFILMYNFNLNSGDTLDLQVINQDCDSVTPITIDSIGILSIMGTDLKVQYISYTAYRQDGDLDHYKISDKIIERIGRIQEFIYSAPVCGIDVVTWVNLMLRCYNDNDLSYKSDWYSELYKEAPCDTLINGNTGIDLNVTNTQLIIYPNPCRDMIILENPSSRIMSVYIYNSSGQLIFLSEPNTYFFELNTSTLMKDLYYLMVVTDSEITTKRLLKL